MKVALTEYGTAQKWTSVQFFLIFHTVHFIQGITPAAFIVIVSYQIHFDGKTDHLKV